LGRWSSSTRGFLFTILLAAVLLALAIVPVIDDLRKRRVVA